MPRIDEQVLDTVFYMYPSKASAEKRSGGGGTGFVAWVPSETQKGMGYAYAVSNRHVVEGSGKKRPSRWLRFNLENDEPEVFEISENEWVPHTTCDISVAFLGQRNYAAMRFSSIPVDRFVDQENVQVLDIGLGDDVLMVGRFIYHEGGKINIPTIRTGVISAMPNEDVKIECEGFTQASYLMEMRSIGGYSGSPIFFSFPFWHCPPIVTNVPNLVNRKVSPDILKSGLQATNLLIGIEAGLFRFGFDVLSKKTLNDTEFLAESYTGFSIVVPAWKILELIMEHPKFKNMRQEHDAQIGRS